MTINIDKLAALSGFNVNEEEKKEFAGRIETLIKYVEPTLKVDLSKTEIKRKIVSFDSLRDDDIKQGLTQQEVLSNCKHVRKGGYCVPKMMD